MNAKKEWTLTEDMMRGQFRDASTEWAGKAWERYGHSGESFGSVGELKRYLTSKGFTDIKESGKGFTAKKDGYEWMIEYSTFANTKSGEKSITGVMTHKGRKIASEKSGLKKLFGKDADASNYHGVMAVLRSKNFVGEASLMSQAKQALQRKWGDELKKVWSVSVKSPADLNGKAECWVDVSFKEGFDNTEHLRLQVLKPGAKDAKDPKQMTEQEIKAELRAIHERIGKRYSVPEKEVESHRAEWKAENERSEALQKELDRRWATKDADFHTEVGKGASARREAFKLAEQKTIESYNKTRLGKQFSIWVVYQSGTGVYSIGPGKGGYKGEKEDKTYQEWKSRPLFLTGKERKEFQAGRYPASAKEQLKKERAQGISDSKDEMSIVADMLNGKFAKDAIPPIKTGGYVQLELEERQMAGWARRSGGKQPGWYVYQDGESYAGPYYSRAEGEEGLRLANRLHPGHKYDLRVIGTRDAKDVKPTTDSGWVEGEMDGCKYQAKVFEEGSMYGIKGGSVSKLQIRKNGKSVLEYDRGSWSGDKQYRNLAYKIANKYDRNVRREPEEAKAYAKWINSGDAKDAAYWEDPKNLSPRDLLREVNEAQVKVQRIKDKGSKEYKDAKAWLDKLMAEVVKRNRAHEAAGGIDKR